MVTQRGAWPLDLERCPADRDFVYWLEANAMQGKMIFHMGPGGHHMVGRRCARDSLNNRVLAITNCVEEMDLYMRHAVRNPHETWRYQLLFGDVSILNPDMLPQFDIVTLFHLGEMPDVRRDEYGRHDNAGVIAMLADQMKPHGALVFYRTSSAWDRVRPLVEAMTAPELNAWDAPVEWRSLLIVKRRY